MTRGIANAARFRYFADGKNRSFVFPILGIRFLVKGAEDGKGNPYESDVFGLAGKGVEFKACAATLRVMDISLEKVLEEAQMVPSGAYEFLRLQTHEGYASLKH